ncbi:MAG: fibrobacter succinogenes major paralogous domain-containing protein [Candidatus Fibromonas sp.]|jgi:uncharacterized protein (TIGR02145 family)|nr:fibrobacter succinogenes major paralogous domain-containing protein [Candidatus Fibromonas sp.]
MSKIVSKLALTASVLLAMAFTFSCSGDDGGGEEKYSYCIKDGFCHEGTYTLEGCSSLGGMPSNNCPNGGGGGSSSSGGGQNPSSSSVGGSSSSIGGGQGSSSSSSGGGQTPSSSSVSVVHGTPVTYEGETYPTVVIGTQTWFAKNLNYAVEGSKCYDNDPANCTEYGRLYDWSTAMGLPSSCNEDSCSSQIQSPHRGICPSGWHIPSFAEWDTLSNYVQSNSGCSDCDAMLLKSTSGWYDNNGTDTYGFSALPGGLGFSDGSFNVVGDYGLWWSADEYNSSIAYGREMSYFDYAYWNYGSKSLLFSVRCVQD